MTTRLPSGHYLNVGAGSEPFRAFIPAPLPPEAMPEVSQFQDLYEKTNRALGRLDGLTALLPDTSLFLYMYIRKEAVLSSQIEGTQSSLSDLLLLEDTGVPGVPLDDVQEVSNYVAALNHGLDRLKGGFPLSLRLMCEIHKVLLSKGRGSGKDPGEFRRSQNWVGGSRPGNANYVPPPPEYLLDCLGALEKFLHNDPVPVPTLIKAALTHVQFESIHPFLDGNGRLGRLLITFLLCSEGALSEPLLYLSLFFKRHREEYYDRLQKVRTEGDWLGWIVFFLTGVKDTSEQACQTAARLLKLFDDDRKKIQTLGRPAGSALRVHHYLQTKPLCTVPTAAKALNLTDPTVRASLDHLTKLGIVRETSGKRRNKVHAYDAYINILNEGTEPF